LLHAQQADVLYVDRENLASARRAADLWAVELQHDPSAFDAAWKLARACYWLGGHVAENERRAFLEQGIKAAQQASQLKPDRPEGHFWTAANMGELADHFGLRAGLRYRGPIRTELETVLRIAPAYLEGAADRALGRYYHELPSLFGGSMSRAEQHLRASLTYDSNSTISRYFLAELLVDAKRLAEARSELRRVLDAPLSTDWAPEDRDFKKKAAELLATLH
jgi:hypothetical protein